MTGGFVVTALTNEQKLFVLYTKGHFQKYIDAKEIILAEAFHLYPAQIHERNTVSFMINLFTKLASLRAIEMNYENPVEWVLKGITDIGSRPLAPQSLYDWLHSHIQGCIADGLDLDIVDRTIENRMTLKR